jgi:hypothetical protein
MRILVDECVDPRIKILFAVDQGLEFQQNLITLRIGIVILHVSKNQLIHFRTIHPELLQAIEDVKPGRIIHVGTPPVSQP